MTNAKLKEAQELFALEDIYVRDMHAFSHPQFDPTMRIENINAQIKLSPSSEAEHFTLQNEDEGKKSHHLRYFVETGIRILQPGIAPERAEPIGHDELLAEITATFVIKYRLTKGDEPPAEELVTAFADNAVHHMWPYWREFIQAATARFRLPTFVLPMRKAAPPDTKPVNQSNENK